jgi:hypothetical protein
MNFINNIKVDYATIRNILDDAELSGVLLIQGAGYDEKAGGNAEWAAVELPESLEERFWVALVWAAYQADRMLDFVTVIFQAEEEMSEKDGWKIFLFKGVQFEGFPEDADEPAPVHTITAGVIPVSAAQVALSPEGK